MVDAELSIELNELITAPVSAASMAPRSFGGRMIGISLIRRSYLTPVELERHDSRKDDDKSNEELEKGGKKDPLLPLGKTLGTQRSLGDELVHAPVKEVRDPEPSNEHREPRHFGVVPRQHGVQLVRVRFEKDTNTARDPGGPTQDVEADHEDEKALRA